VPAPPLRRNRDFVLLQSGQLLSDAGTQLTAIAYPLLTLAVTGSAAKAGIVAFARMLPLALLAMPAGLAADRWSRRRLMVGADAVRALAVACLGAAVLLDEAAFWAIALVAFVEGAGAATFSAAQAGALRAVVPRAQLPAAVGVRSGRQAAVNLVGPPLGGALFGLSRALPFLADAASYTLSIGSLLGVRAPFEEDRERDRSPLRVRVAEGFRFLWGQPFLRTCALLFGLANFIGPGLLLAVVVIAEEQGLSARRIGVLVAAFGGCVLLGSFLSPLVRRSLSVRAVLVLELWCWLGCAVFLLRPNVYVLVAGMVPAALAIPSTDSVVHGYRIAMTPDRLLGRSESVRSTISLAVAPLGPLVAGALLTGSTPRATIALFAASALVLAVWGTVSGPIRAAPALAELDDATPAASRADAEGVAPSPAGRTPRRCRGPV
jgi:Transmembrane secretion effector